MNGKFTKISRKPNKKKNNNSKAVQEVELNPAQKTSSETGGIKMDGIPSLVLSELPGGASHAIDQLLWLSGLENLEPRTPFFYTTFFCRWRERNYCYTWSLVTFSISLIYITLLC